MKKYFLLLILFSLISCSNVATKIAILQDNAIDNKLSIMNNDTTFNYNDELTINQKLFLFVSRFINKSNLVIRHLTLQDIYNNNNVNEKNILKLVKVLSYYNDTIPENPLIWAEGYSYYEYTKVPISIYLKSNMDSVKQQIRDMLDLIENGFMITSFYNSEEHLFYPLLLGDLRKEPLNYFLQEKLKSKNTQIKCDISINPYINQYYGYNKSIVYKLKARPIGFNIHIPVKDSTIFIYENGKIANFEYYRGIEYKYKSSFSQLLDLMQWNRIKTLF